jgi:hypothetical protein
MADGNYNRGGAGGPPKDRVNHALNDFRFRLVGQQKLEGAAKPPSLGFNVMKDGLALNAYTNVQGDEDNGRISITLPLPDVMLLVTMLERADRLAPGQSNDLALAATEFDRQANGPSQPRLKMTLKIGRNDRGVIFISIASWKRTRPVITLDLVPSNLVRLIDSQGNPAPADKVSELYSVSWAKALSSLVPLIMNDHYVPPKPRDPPAGGGNQGGGYNQGGGQQQNRGQQGSNYSGGGNQGGGYGGGQQAQAPVQGGGYDDGLPM